MAKAKYNPSKTSNIKDDSFAAFISERGISEDLKSIPGIGDATVTKFEAKDILTTHQLFAKFLSLRTPGISMKKHIDAFFDFLTDVGIGAYKSAIVKAVAEKTNTWIPSIYDDDSYLAADGASSGAGSSS